MGLGTSELLVIALIAVVLFGSGRIAALGKGLGQGIRHFRQGLRADVEAPVLPSSAPPALPGASYAPELQEGMTRHAQTHRS
jgi:sec-independent protein translocase protein TatA